MRRKRPGDALGGGPVLRETVREGPNKPQRQRAHNVHRGVGVDASVSGRSGAAGEGLNLAPVPGPFSVLCMVLASVHGAPGLAPAPPWGSVKWAPHATPFPYKARGSAIYVK